ncbi:MAG TPA: hypothetical protein VHB48_06295 [Chitinophagaceae bacterium]|nr:hypothetical protein [Chitinophagaceae bacterium]
MKTNPKMGTLIFVVLGALVSIASGIISYREKLSAERKSLAKDSVITQLRDTLNQVVKQLNTRTDEIIALNNKLLDTTESLSNAYKENAELQKSVNAFITGGTTSQFSKLLRTITQMMKG